MTVTSRVGAARRMKPILVFLAGALTMIVVSAAFVIFLFTPKNLGTKEQPLPGGEQLIDSTDRFTVSGTVVVPEALKSVVQSGKGRLSIWLATDSGQQGLRPIVADQLHPKFPFKFSHAFSMTELSRSPNLKRNLAVGIFYKESEDTGSALEKLYLEPRVAAIYVLPFSEQEIKSKTLPSSFELGETAFYTYYTRAITEPCLSDTTLLAGKISPGSAFLREHGRDKFALVVYERSLHGWIEEGDPEGRIVHEQFLDFSSGAAAFSVPMKKTSFPYYSVFAVRCEAGDVLSTCVRRAFPLYGYNKYRYAVLSPDLKVPFCGTTQFNGTIGPLSGELLTKRSAARETERGGAVKP